ncbi:MAG: peptidase M24 [Desulfobacterales bacterium]|nr:MAG: peptidase M24 [Desulfobacterales bacterium]
MDYAKRRHKLQRQLKRKKLDALLISQPHNRRYLTGYSASDHDISETSGLVLIPASGTALLLTDFRYELQARHETDMEVVLYTKGLLPLLDTLVSELKIRSLGFESGYTLHSTWTKIAALAAKKNITLKPTSGLVEKMRLIKSDAEIELMRKSVRLNEAVFEDIFPTISAGMTEQEIARSLENKMYQAGAESPSFETIVVSGANGALPHGRPSEARVVEGKPVTIDMGLVLSGYCSDMTRNFVVGEPDRHYLTVHRLVRKAQKAGMAAVRNGATAAEVDRAARKIIGDAGYGKNFGHSLGHGVGLAVHEDPRVSGQSRRKLKTGMVITIEPGIYIPGWGGVRLENMVVVTEDGCENLNTDNTWLDL